MEKRWIKTRGQSKIHRSEYQITWFFFLKREDQLVFKKIAPDYLGAAQKEDQITWFITKRAPDYLVRQKRGLR